MIRNWEKKSSTYIWICIVFIINENIVYTSLKTVRHHRVFFSMTGTQFLIMTGKVMTSAPEAVTFSCTAHA